jgi:hypothetical protein
MTFGKTTPAPYEKLESLKSGLADLNMVRNLLSY